MSATHGEYVTSHDRSLNKPRSGVFCIVVGLLSFTCIIAGAGLLSDVGAGGCIAAHEQLSHTDPTQTPLNPRTLNMSARTTARTVCCKQLPDLLSILCAGGCPAANQQLSYTVTDTTGICLPGSTMPELPPPSSAVHCNGHKMTAGSTWLGLAGLAIIAVLMHRQVKVSKHRNGQSYVCLFPTLVWGRYGPC